MRLRDYFRGRAIELESPLRRDALEARIEAATVSRWGPLNSGVVGTARSGRLRLRYRPRRFEYEMDPILVGRVEEAPSGSSLRLRYRAPPGAYVFFGLWVPAMALLLVVMLLDDSRPEPDAHAATGAFPVWTLLPLLLLPFLGVYLGTRRADGHLDALLKFLEEVGEARVASRHGPRRP